MIIDFTIQNFRSIKGEQLFSMHVESPKQHLAQHVAYPADDKIGVLRSAGIYGANASGKSNVLLALSALQAVACFSGNSREGDPIPWYLPYYLSDQTRNDPIRFEIEFFNTDKLRYVYAVSFDHERILQEVLDFFPTRQKANLFTRDSTDTWETITFGGRYKGGVKRIPFFNNNSYLSKAGENAGASAIIRSVYKYLATKLIDLEIQNHLPYGDLYQKNNLLTDAARLLTHIDTGITGIEQRTDENQHEFQKLQVRPRSEIRNTARQKSAIEFWFSHITEEGTIEQFPQDWESAGTQQLFRFMPLLFNAFQSGSTLIIDEIERSLHPHVAELIIKVFNDPSINTNDAQLIFTTHNINLMAPDKMRRDQIWFTDKKNGKTTLYSLDDFDKNKVKSDSPFPAWYNDGRFDAVPHIDYLSIANLLRPEAKPAERNAEDSAIETNQAGAAHA